MKLDLTLTLGLVALLVAYGVGGIAAFYVFRKEFRIFKDEQFPASHKALADQFPPVRDGIGELREEIRTLEQQLTALMAKADVEKKIEILEALRHGLGREEVLGVFKEAHG